MDLNIILHIKFESIKQYLLFAMYQKCLNGKVSQS